MVNTPIGGKEAKKKKHSQSNIRSIVKIKIHGIYCHRIPVFFTLYDYGIVAMHYKFNAY